MRMGKGAFWANGGGQRRKVKRITPEARAQVKWITQGGGESAQEYLNRTYLYSQPP